MQHGRVTKEQQKQLERIALLTLQLNTLDDQDISDKAQKKATRLTMQLGVVYDKLLQLGIKLHTEYSVIVNDQAYHLCLTTLAIECKMVD